jgi:small subunit ribosomal protein S8
MSYIDLIIKIKNAQKAKKELVKHPYSKMNESILLVLSKRKFISGFEVKGKGYKKYFEINLKNSRQITKVQLLSKPSVKKYAGYKEIKPVRGGFGVLILSTNQGILSGEEARKKGVGGQLLVAIS